MGFFSKIKNAFKKTKTAIDNKLLQIFSKGELDDEFFEELEYVLVSSDIGATASEEIVEKLRAVASKQKLRNQDDVKVALRNIMVEILQQNPQPEINYPLVLMVVGVNGVGKTTTIPKIAAQYMKSGKKVSFVTIDNYRIAAVDQLQRYASIMKVPFTSASTPEALRAEIRKMDNSSLLFIDTMGRSPKGAEDIVAMSKYFTTVGRFDMDIQLVMSATAKYKDALKILNGFKPTNYKGVILTKVDETDYLASSICAIIKKKLPITYITHGQGVPKDISTAKKYGYKLIEGLFGKI